MAEPSEAANAPEADPLDSPVATLVRRAPVCCAADTPIRRVLETMREEDIGSMVVVRDGHEAIGIFTLHDLLYKVALAESDLARPIEAVMRRPLVSLAPEAPAYEAALLMTRHAIRHVLVIDGARLVGVVSERDLFSLQQVSLRMISGRIRHARTVDALAPAAAEIRHLAEHMTTQGTGAEQLTRYIATLNDLIASRVIEILCEDMPGLPPFCWLAVGSEGRHEQTLATDQDNAIVFEVPGGASAQSVRDALLPLAARVNDALDRLGYARCRGNIMAGNPRWCLSADEWRDAFAGWLDCPDPHALLSSCIFFDFRPVHGDTAPAERLRGWLTGAAAAHERFQLLMARNALAHQPALGLVRDFAVTSGGEHPHTIDLKAGAAGVFVDVARVLALRAGVAATGTVARLRAAAPRLGIAAPDVNAWVRAFQFIQWLRLSSQCAQLAAGGPAHNHVDPYRVDELDRRILRESLRQGRILQDRLARLVQADAPGFGA